MVRHQLLPTQIIVSIAGAMLIGTFTAVPAHADDPLLPIIQTIQRDRQNECPNSGILSGDKRLEAIAQDYARSENLAKLPSSPPGYSRLLPTLGSGDPEAQAINMTYKHGAGQIIGTCDEFAYGVGFVRHDDRSVDVVTIVFGVLTPPLHPASIHLKPGQGSFYIFGSGFSQNNKISISFHYHNNSNNSNTYNDPPTIHQIDAGGNFDTIVPVSTMIPGGSLDVVATDGVLSATKFIKF